MVFPEVIDELSTARVLCMGFIDGTKILSVDRTWSDPKRIARIGLETLLKMIFEDGFVHADLHPGNILITPEHKIAMLDLGLVGELDPPHRRSFARFFAAWAQRDGDTMARLMYSMSSADPNDVAGFERFRAAIIEFVGRYWGQRLGEVQVGKVLFDMLGILRRHRLAHEPGLHRGQHRHRGDRGHRQTARSGAGSDGGGPALLYCASDRGRSGLELPPQSCSTTPRPRRSRPFAPSRAPASSTSPPRPMKVGFSPTDPEWCNLGQGQPETGPLPGAPPRVPEITIDPDDLEYAPVPGIWELREAIASLYNRLYRRGMPSQYTAENVGVSGGGRAALTRAAASLGSVNLGHFLPDYTAYEELLDIFKAFTAIPILLEGERGYGFSVEDLRREVLGRGPVGAAAVQPVQPDRQAGPGRGAGALGGAGARARLHAAARRVLLALRLDRAARARCRSRAPPATSRTSTAIRWSSSTA